jgi:hypothetical protein
VTRPTIFSVALAGLLVAAGLVAGGASSAVRPKTLASHCSPSGDVCYGVFDRNGAISLELTTVAHYFARYRLCVKQPVGGAAGFRRCGSYPVFRRGSGWGSSVRYARQFPPPQPGLVRVTWSLGDRPLGPALTFRVPST